jgi:prophage regulatory protein
MLNAVCPYSRPTETRSVREALTVTTIPNSPTIAIHKILRLPQVCEVTGLCRSQIYQMEAELRFPRRIKIGTRAVGWLEQDVQAWLGARIEASRSS